MSNLQRLLIEPYVEASKPDGTMAMLQNRWMNVKSLSLIIVLQSSSITTPWIIDKEGHSFSQRLLMNVLELFNGMD